MQQLRSPDVGSSVIDAFYRHSKSGVFPAERRLGVNKTPPFGANLISNAMLARWRIC
jgi:hypothetical protein